MKVAFFTYGMLEQGGGLEKFFIEMTSELVKRYPSLSISIITLSEQRTESLQKILSIYYLKKMPIKNVHRESLENILLKLGKVNYIKCNSFKEVKEKLKLFDVVYTKNELLELILLKIFNYKELPPIVVGMHTPVFIPNPLNKHDRLHNFLYTGFFYKFLLKGIKMIHVINEDDLRLFKKKFNLENIKKVLLPFKQKELIKQDFTKKNEVFNILFVGRLVPQKGIDIFIKCIVRLQKEKEFRFFSFCIAGSGDDEFTYKIKDLTQKYSNVKYLGHVSNDKIDNLYNWADVVMVPSRFETANYVSLEAGSHERIVVVSDIPGPREIIQNNETGFLVDVNAEIFCEKIKYIFDLKRNNEKEFLSIGRKAREYIKFKFLPEKIYEKFNRMLKESVENKN